MSEKKSNSNLRKANTQKNDEFYTQFSDIEKEVKHYKEHLKGKIVYCNCDNPEWSNFYNYLYNAFNFLGLKKLITTHYEGGGGNSYKLEVIDKNQVVKTPLIGNGDFRSDECIQILKECDVVITNPPFSLFREYIAQLMEYDKKFLIIGNVNAITYKETFKLIKENKVWLGHNVNKTLEFELPSHYEKWNRIDKNTGKKYGNVPAIAWYTNLTHSKRNEEIILYKQYDSSYYPKYDNYDAIDVSKTKEIPMDYDGVMGVPITFMDKYNPNQFDIVALGIVGSIDFTKNKKMEILDKVGNPTGKYTFNAKGTLYKIYNQLYNNKPPAFKDCETGELYSSIYARILIKNKNPKQ